MTQTTNDAVKVLRFTKKPVTIEAIEYTGGGNFANPAMPNWMWQALEDGTAFNRKGALFLKTLEGEHAVSAGDWVIRGVKGELYPCKPDIFAMTYEPERAAIQPAGDARCAVLEEAFVAIEEKRRATVNDPSAKNALFDATEIIRDLQAAPAAPVQAALRPNHSIACSACYGTGYGVDGKACPCGCRAPAVQAAPVDTSEYRFRVYDHDGLSIAVCPTLESAQTWPKHFSSFKIVEKLAPEVKASELPSIADDGQFKMLLAQYYTSDEDTEAMAAERAIFAYIDARSPVAAPQPDVSARDAALAKINEIRNSIIGCQTVNWSAHVYPLVAALEEAGIAGEGWEVASKKAQTLLDRANSAEDELAALKSAAPESAEPSAGARQVPDAACVQGKCGDLAARCRGACALQQHPVILAQQASLHGAPQTNLESAIARLSTEMQDFDAAPDHGKGTL